MKVLILSGVFSDRDTPEVLAQAKRAVEFSANLLQQKLICGFRKATADVTVLSAPFLGAFPQGSRTFRFRSFSEPCEEYTYVPFNNLWGVRNFSRYHALKRAMKDFLASDDEEKLILAYCPHTPFVKAAAYAKRRDASVRTCLFVPDLPEYMNLSERVSPIYKFAKGFDIAEMKRAMQYIDTYVLLTEEMKERLPVEKKPYFVCEGLVAPEARETEDPVSTDSAKTIVYTGKLDLRFGIGTLLDAMVHLKDEDVSLILCGTGDALPYASERAKEDRRIKVLGQVPPDEARRYQKKAAVLVNPRASTEDYTRYSFPSKTLEYLLCDGAVVAHVLPGMPEVYRSFLICPQKEDAKSLSLALSAALNLPTAEKAARKQAFSAYAEAHLDPAQVAHKIIRLGK